MLRGRAPLIIAIVLGVLAAVLHFNTLKRKEAKIQEGWNLVPVVVAARDIPEGTTLDYDMMSQYSIPEKFITSSVVRPKHFEKVIGQKLMLPLQRGDLILWSHFRSESSYESLSNLVQKRGRAISLPIGGTAGVSGWLRPNDHVDILGTFTDPKNGQTFTTTLMQNVILLATGHNTATSNPFRDLIMALDKSFSSYGDITIMVLPEEAEILVMAQQSGGLYLTLRNPADIGGEEERGRTTIETVLTGERVKALKQKRESTIQILRLPTGTTATGSGIR